MSSEDVDGAVAAEASKPSFSGSGGGTSEVGDATRPPCKDESSSEGTVWKDWEEEGERLGPWWLRPLRGMARGGGGDGAGGRCACWRGDVSTIVVSDDGG